jgi:hypothetical protein
MERRNDILLRARGSGKISPISAPLVSQRLAGFEHVFDARQGLFLLEKVHKGLAFQGEDHCPRPPGAVGTHIAAGDDVGDPLGQESVVFADEFAA